MSVRKMLSDYPEVSFIDNMSIEDIQEYYLKSMKQKYRELTGNELIMKDADPELLRAYADCLILYQIAQYADRAGKMALLRYSYGDFLENIGAIKGISRLEGAAAVTNLQFTLSVTRNNVTIIPQGTRVTAGDSMYFETLDILEIPAGALTGEVHARCKIMGIKGNGYMPGELKILVDPVPYVSKVENLVKTEGGADRESDDNLAERIFLAPSSWSTAGPDDAYKYWVKTFDPGITDVEVYSDVPGIVDIWFILQEGQIPDETMITELEEFLKNEEIRPLTDQVIVRAPEIQDYDVDLTYYINKSDRTRASTIQEQVHKIVDEYVLWQKEKIGRDINPDQLRRMIITAGAKRVEVRSPEFRRLPRSSIALAGNVNVLYGGIEDD